MVYTLLGHFDVEMTPFRKHPVAWSGVAVHAAPRHHSTVARHGKGRRDILPTSPHARPLCLFPRVTVVLVEMGRRRERGEIEFKSRRSRSLARFLAREQSEFLSSTSSSPLSVRRRRDGEMMKWVNGFSGIRPRQESREDEELACGRRTTGFMMVEVRV